MILTFKQLTGKEQVLQKKLTTHAQISNSNFLQINAT
jgi:hypothetical protein